ncbi:hypothetical protein AVEN_156746-1 [Araneus ventricosus]|uniref:Uncharacterized protein n=1 Tax=Araneus ventricosus TaxID=182803 RepID=A0A4Y2NPG3_ARAVE|nr:hypothetical protein AVEN_156746-1 [Araneus ventricosus]
MTRTTPGLTSPLKTPAPHQRENVWSLRLIQRAADKIHGGSSVELGFEPAALRTRGQNLTTSPPWPHTTSFLLSGNRQFFQLALLQFLLSPITHPSC